LSVRKRKSDSYSENANDGLTIFDAPNVCREIMAKCESLAERAEPEIAGEIRKIGDDAQRMLDAIVASTDQILAMGALE
jgi:hypothetical protein